MRPIKFRGKGIKSGQWFYGYAATFGNKAYIFEMFRLLRMEHAEVDPTTVGQFTGLQDANGTDVYEGDIVRYQRNKKTYQVVFKDGIFWGEGENGCGCAAHFFPSCEIIGNIHDLIEKGGEL